MLEEITSIPVEDVAGTRSFPSGVTVTPSWIPNAFGIDGPVISASRIPTFAPVARIRHAIKDVTKDFPTPPLPLTTPITFFTELAGFNFSRKLCGSLVLLPQFAEQVPQLWVQFSAVSLITISLSNCYSGVTVQYPHSYEQKSIPDRLRRWDFCLQTCALLRSAQQVRRPTE